MLFGVARRRAIPAIFTFSSLGATQIKPDPSFWLISSPQIVRDGSLSVVRMVPYDARKITIAPT